MKLGMDSRPRIRELRGATAMTPAWDAKRGLACLLEALGRTDWDADMERDVIEVEALLTEAATRRAIAARTSVAQLSYA
jgi:hypothetical protein